MENIKFYGRNVTNIDKLQQHLLVISVNIQTMKIETVMLVHFGCFFIYYNHASWKHFKLVTKMKSIPNYLRSQLQPLTNSMIGKPKLLFELCFFIVISVFYFKQNKTVQIQMFKEPNLNLYQISLMWQFRCAINCYIKCCRLSMLFFFFKVCENYGWLSIPVTDS